MDDVSPEDGRLLAGVAARRPSAFMAVYDRCAVGAYALALRLVGKVEPAEAVIEDVFLALWRNPHEAIAEPNGLQAYLARAVRHRALGYREEA